MFFVCVCALLWVSEWAWVFTFPFSLSIVCLSIPHVSPSIRSKGAHVNVYLKFSDNYYNRDIVLAIPLTHSIYYLINELHNTHLKLIEWIVFVVAITVYCCLLTNIQPRSYAFLWCIVWIVSCFVFFLNEYRHMCLCIVQNNDCSLIFWLNRNSCA